jgi:hypothetical protein
MPWFHRSFWLGPLIIATVLGLLVLVFSRGRLRKVYKEQFQESRRERLFLASLGFFVTVFVVRGITIAIHYDFGPFHNVSMHGRHIHHMVGNFAAADCRLLLAAGGRNWLAEVADPSRPSDLDALWSRCRSDSG